MADLDRVSELGRVQYSGDEESNGDDESNRDGEEQDLNSQVIFDNMLRVARRMNCKDRQQQLVLLSLAIAAITEAGTDPRSGTGVKTRRSQGAATVKEAMKQDVRSNSLNSSSPSGSRTPKKWLPEDRALVEKLRGEKVGWAQMAEYHFPGRTMKQIKSSWHGWQRKIKDAIEKEKQLDEDPVGAEVVERETGWSDQITYES